MKALTIGKILNDYQDFLTDYEIEKLKDVQKRQTTFSTQVKELQRALFGEETDFISDSGVEYNERSRGINPMAQAYTDRVNKKREAFGVTPLSKAGYADGNSSDLFCKEVVRHTKNYKELLDLKKSDKKQIVFVDMDDVLVNFKSGIDQISDEDRKKYDGDMDEVPGIFSLMKPYEGAIKAYKWLCEYFEVYILSTASWDNPSAWTDKLLWVKKYLPDLAYKRLILSHNKHLAKGDFLIDDRKKNGAGEFSGKHLYFGPEEEKDFKDWKAVIAYMKNLT
jgi:5'(3')-deoxyribonucleotidase